MEYLLTAKNETFTEKKMSVAFVDYETWLYGCSNQYHTEPDVMGWFTNLKDKGQIDDVLFFADLTKDPTRNQALRLRSISNNIIDCSKGDREKDYSDFIMLDHIYQRLIRQPDIKQFILFTGDGHFQSVVAFLKNFNDKIIGIYSLKGSLSPQLAEAANWYVEIVPPDEQDKRNAAITKLIIDNLLRLEDQGKIATFNKTISVIHSGNPQYREDEVRSILSAMVSDNRILKVDTVLPSSGFLAKKLLVNRGQSIPKPEKIVEPLIKPIAETISDTTSELNAEPITESVTESTTESTIETTPEI